MGFIDAVKSAFRKYVVFSGRAARSEYWWFFLFAMIGSIVAGILDLVLFGSSVTTETSYSATTAFTPLNTLFSLAILLPSLSISVRRFHDLDRTGWWLLAWLVPMVLVFIVGGVASVMADSTTATDGLFVILAFIVGALLVALGMYIWMIVWFATEGTVGENRFGPDPVDRSEV